MELDDEKKKLQELLSNFQLNLKYTNLIKQFLSNSFLS